MQYTTEQGILSTKDARPMEASLETANRIIDCNHVKEEDS